MELRSVNIKSLKFEPLVIEDEEDSDSSLSVNSEQIDIALYEQDVAITKLHRETPIRLLPDAEVESLPVPPSMKFLPETEVPLDSDSSDASPKSKKKSKKEKKKRKEKEKKRKHKEKKRKKDIELLDPIVFRQMQDAYEIEVKESIKQFITKLERAPEGAISKQAAEEYLSKEFIRGFRKEVMCAICQDILKEPVLLKTCAHRFCKDCIETHIRVSKKACPMCIKAIETRRLMRNDTKICEMISVLEGDFLFIEMEDEQEKNDLSKSIVREQELFNEIKKRQMMDYKNSFKKKTSKSSRKRGKSKGAEKTAEEREAEKVISEENYNRRPDNDIIIMQDDYQYKKYPLVKKMRILVNELCPILFLGKYVAYKNKFDVIIWPNIQFFMQSGDKLRKIKHIDRISEVKKKFGITENRFTIFYRKIVTKSYPKYMNLINNARKNMKPYMGVTSCDTMVHNNSIQIGNSSLSNIKSETIKDSDVRMEEELKGATYSNQDRINQLNGVSNNLESALSNLFS